MTITKKLVFWLICITIIPLITFKYIVSRPLTKTIKDYAVEEAKGRAELAAMAITAEPFVLPPQPLLKKPEKSLIFLRIRQGL